MFGRNSSNLDPSTNGWLPYIAILVVIVAAVAFAFGYGWL